MAKILIVDEEPISRRFVAMVLRTGGHRVLQAADCDMARKIVDAEQPELVLIDILTPSIDGCQLVVDLCAAPGPAALRFLFRGAANMEAETRALARTFGAGFLAKPASAPMLTAVIDATLAAPASGLRGAEAKVLGALVNPIVNLIRRVAERNVELEVARAALDMEIKKRIWAERELTRTNLMLRDEAMHDVVTGLHNRRYLEGSLPREESRARRSGQPLAIVMVDIDNFKAVNDTLGHAAGDAVLRAVGGCMTSLARGEDIVARYGGDEFTLVMAQATQQIAWERAELLRSGVRQLSIGVDGQQLGPVTLSVGIGMFPEHGPSGKEVMQAADKALIRSKMSGRNRIAVGA